MEASVVTAKPGWYPDPHTGHPRWWDGGTWGPPLPAPTPAAAGNVLIYGGYILATLLPIIGLILGVYTATRPGRRSYLAGVGMLVLSVVAAILWYTVLQQQNAPIDGGGPVTYQGPPEYVAPPTY